MARLRSHPEEFIKSVDVTHTKAGISDWRWATNLVVHHPEKCPYLDPDERDQFVRSYWDVQEKHFNEKVISQLLHLDAD
tara:strand:- start:6191 stop:6427 length:237 start_codon:yes stop_codon:yes gene_type:complete